MKKIICILLTHWTLQTPLQNKTPDRQFRLSYPVLQNIMGILIRLQMML